MVNTTSTLDGLLDSVAHCFTPEVAQRIIDLRIDPQFQAHVDDLADKANQGKLTDGERSEYVAIVDTTDLIAILKAKSRRILAPTVNE